MLETVMFNIINSHTIIKSDIEVVNDFLSNLGCKFVPQLAIFLFEYQFIDMNIIVS